VNRGVPIWRTVKMVGWRYSSLLLHCTPFHVVCIGLLALFCQDAFAKKRVTIRSLFALTTVASFELAMIRLVAALVNL
jgi:GNAT superfamily N-acetyltransferase